MIMPYIYAAGCGTAPSASTHSQPGIAGMCCRKTLPWAGLIISEIDRPTMSLREIARAAYGDLRIVANADHIFLLLSPSPRFCAFSSEFS